LQEADTTTEWDQQTVRRFLSERAISSPSRVTTSSTPTDKAEDKVAKSQVAGIDHRLELAAKEFADALQATDIEGLSAYWATARGLPPEFDRRLLPTGRHALGRDLEPHEKKFIRGRVQQFVQDRIKRNHIVA
jgi:hypothetical protein